MILFSSIIFFVVLLKESCTIKWGDVLNSGAGWQWTVVIPFPHGNSLNSAYSSHVTRCLCLRLLTEGFCFPQPQNLWNFPTILTFIFCPPKQQFSNGKTWCLKIKLWSKVIFSKCVQGLCRNIFLICRCHRLLLFWQEKFE